MYVISYNTSIVFIAIRTNAKNPSTYACRAAIDRLFAEIYISSFAVCIPCTVWHIAQSQRMCTRRIINQKREKTAQQQYSHQQRQPTKNHQIHKTRIVESPKDPKDLYNIIKYKMKWIIPVPHYPLHNNFVILRAYQFIYAVDIMN